MKKLFIHYLLFFLFCTASQSSSLDPLFTEKYGLTRYETDEFYLLASSELFLEELKETVTATRKQLIDLLGDSLVYKPNIYIVEEIADFNDFAGNRIPDWGAAVALPLKKAVLVKSPANFNLSKSLEELVAHEYAHLLIDQVCRFREPPRWINEGVAQLVSTEWAWSDNLAMNKAVIFGQILPLDSIRYVNRFNESKAQVAYAESYLSVKFMLDEYGPKSLAIFLNNIGAGRSEADALYSATGSSKKEFEGDFSNHLHQLFNWLSLFMDTAIFWLALAVVLIIGAYLKFKKRREYYKKWEEEEKLHSTDFDYGEEPEQFEDDEPWRD